VKTALEPVLGSPDSSPHPHSLNHPAPGRTGNPRDTVGGDEQLWTERLRPGLEDGYEPLDRVYPGRRGRVRSQRSGSEI